MNSYLVRTNERNALSNAGKISNYPPQLYHRSLWWNSETRKKYHEIPPSERTSAADSRGSTMVTVNEAANIVHSRGLGSFHNLPKKRLAFCEVVEKGAAKVVAQKNCTGIPPAGFPVPRVCFSHPRMSLSYSG